MYLQSWRTNTRSKNLPKDLKDMVKVADKYNLHMDGLAISREIQREAILWHHIKSDATRGTFNRGEQTLCLKNNHKIMTVGGAVDMARRHGTALHQNRRDCRCASCTDMRHTYHCHSPWRCYQRARVLLDTLPNK
jgi:hypothetical protein